MSSVCVSFNLRAAGISSTPFSELEKLIIQRGRDCQQQPDIYFQISHAFTQIWRQRFRVHMPSTANSQTSTTLHHFRNLKTFCGICLTSEKRLVLLAFV